MRSGIFVGLSTIDLIHTVDDFPPANTKAVARNQEVMAGGPATNAAITFGYLGGHATLVSAVGRHALADLLKKELQRFSVSLLDLTPSSEEPPPISSVWVNQRGQRSVVSVNTVHLRIATPQVDYSMLGKARVLLVDGHSMEACQGWAAAARAQSIPVVFDGGSWKPGTEQLLKNVDTAICSADFSPLGCVDEDAVMHYLQAAGVRQAAVTHGANPVRFAVGSTIGFIEVPQVDAVDTTGAGDIFHGAFCYYSSAGGEFTDALRRAAELAADSCRFRGTRGWMQSQRGSRH